MITLMCETILKEVGDVKRDYLGFCFPIFAKNCKMYDFALEEIYNEADYIAYIMAGTNVCRLCRTSCSDCIRLCDATGKTNEIYTITVKFFHPMFLEVDKEMTHRIVVLCMQCWHHISGFNNFQQTVLLLHANLHTATESVVAGCAQLQFTSTSCENRDEIEIAANEELEKIKDEPGTIVIPDIDSNQNRQTGEADNTGQLIVTDHAIVFPANLNPNTAAPPSNANVPSTSNETMPFKIENAMHIDDQYSDQDGDIFIANELIDETENSHSSDDDDLLEIRDTQDSADSVNELQIPTSRKDRKSQKGIDEIIAKWKPVLQCEYCPKSFATFTLLKSHYCDDHPNNEFFIMCCGRKLKYRYRVEEHAIIHMNPKAFKCQVCGKCFTARFTWMTHTNHSHPEAKISKDDGGNGFKCSICGLCCGDAATMLQHCKIHSNDKKLHHCQFCNKSFKKERGLNKHLYIYHLSCRPQSSDIIQTCPHCPKTFNYRTGLYHHLRRTHPAEFALRKKKRRINNTTTENQ
ncbi:transcription factor grauzone-like [Musca vetustissima]|uniref:transcription factor grauzone-like n=1 Tax=Musca vetustissima TaxID=27455 RepID=UPI002AB6B062|nr:transcription factor grauzone-like [Musca vetustissima]